MARPVMDDSLPVDKWYIPYEVYQCPKGSPWFGMRFEDAVKHGFRFEGYDYSYRGRLRLWDDMLAHTTNDPANYDYQEFPLCDYVEGNITRGLNVPGFAGRESAVSDIVRFGDRYWYINGKGWDVTRIDPFTKKDFGTYS